MEHRIDKCLCGLKADYSVIIDVSTIRSLKHKKIAKNTLINQGFCLKHSLILANKGYIVEEIK
ncbi:MAG: hypothetical protein PHY56_06290 [Candidatus Omnitrophica bacterium]|jgi:hypothetical protein|nr:hypothetical protein [Candidatus Omnitrophota bacterium]